MTETITLPNGRSFTVVGGAREAPTAAKGKGVRSKHIPLAGSPVASGTLTLTSIPPSVNSIFFNRPKGKGRGKTLAYRNWRAIADRELRDQPSWHVPGKVVIKIRVGPARGDIDNRIKATLDLLVCAGRIEDDKHVAFVSAERDIFAGTSITIARVA